MILREYQKGKFVKITVVNDSDFLLVNKDGFFFVDELPFSNSGFYLLENGSYVVDAEKESEFLISEQNRIDTVFISVQISDSIEFLSRTDHKVLPDYEPTPDEDIEQIKAERIAKRRFIRENRNA